MSSEEKRGAPINEGHFKCRWLQVSLRQDFSLFTAVLWIRILIKLKGSIRIRIRIEVISWIWIRIKVIGWIRIRIN
jgi:hypothetical protein